MAVSGPMIMAKAKQLNEDLKVNSSCKFSVGSLRSFKKRYRIRELNITGERKSANPEAAAQFRASFQSILSEHGHTANEVYNADETGINWKCLPTKTLAHCVEKQATGFKHNKERLTILVCGNTSVKHKLKLPVIGKSARPQAFKI
ncbi:DDE superfamily endonuclease domain [Trinorchestia longiramus]|nr:DDE superfamily endonuclease domain [Trinorchestia longiramus]